MADIYEFVKKSDNCRPVYTSYELSKMVKEKREKTGLGISEFAVYYGITEKMVNQIEAGNSSFSPKMYKACGKILDLSEEKLLAEEIDDLEAVNYRVSENGDDVKATFEMANMLFNEIIMQKKIGIH